MEEARVERLPVIGMVVVGMLMDVLGAFHVLPRFGPDAYVFTPSVASECKAMSADQPEASTI